MNSNISACCLSHLSVLSAPVPHGLQVLQQQVVCLEKAKAELEQDKQDCLPLLESYR